ncbi:SAM-dependent methyltransferase [Actinocrispum sp. NPDC049592]|uniref:SAM-dependent methyltransferase n=1 Tax=Actinocrispum sp. NPDC049592 TaxID=3154835 RepID=UPI0034282713
MTSRGDDARRVDTARPSITRVYDAMLGGKDNFQADRDVRDRLLALDPEFGRASWDNREFTMRVTRFLAGEIDITQFIDLGAVLPTMENAHEVAQRVNREATVIYASIDQAVLAHGRALLAENDRTHVAEADFRLPQQVLENATVTKYIDFDQPVALFLVAIMNHVSDRRDPAAIVRAYIDAIPSGSYVALSHLLDPGPDHELAPLMADIKTIYADAGFPGWFRSYEQIEAMFTGLELLPPGLVTLADWWPDGPRLRPLAPVQRLLVGGVGRKP